MITFPSISFACRPYILHPSILINSNNITYYPCFVLTDLHKAFTIDTYKRQRKILEVKMLVGNDLES